MNLRDLAQEIFRVTDESARLDRELMDYRRRDDYTAQLTQQLQEARDMVRDRELKASLAEQDARVARLHDRQQRECIANLRIDLEQASDRVSAADARVVELSEQHRALQAEHKELIAEHRRLTEQVGLLENRIRAFQQAA